MHPQHSNEISAFGRKLLTLDELHDDFHDDADRMTSPVRCSSIESELSDRRKLATGLRSYLREKRLEAKAKDRS